MLNGDKRRSGQRCRWGILLFVTLLMVVFASHGEAACRVGPQGEGKGGDSQQGSLGSFHFNLPSLTLVPEGGLLASNALMPWSAWSDTSEGGVILICRTMDDVRQARISFATNGDEPFSGKYAVSGHDGWYHTTFKGVASEILIGQEKATRNWRSYAVTDVPNSFYLDEASGQYFVTMRALKPIRINFYRVAPYNGTVSGGWGLLYQIPLRDSLPQPWSYDTNQPLFYYVVNGPGLPRPTDGADSAFDIAGWPGNWLGFGLYSPRATMTRKAGCIIDSLDRVVWFGTTPASQLQSGLTVTRPFQVQLRCDDNASGRLYFSPGPGASGAINLLSGASRYLVDIGRHGDDALASGIGIEIRANRTGETQPIVDGALPGSMGLRLIEEASATRPAESGITMATHDFTAVLGRLPGETVMPGRFDIAAQVNISLD